jgi:ferredoxin
MNFTQQCEKSSVRQHQQKEKPMPDRNNKVPQNICGPYYVDDTCIDCDLCRSTVPQLFARYDQSGFSYVYRQPVTPEEFAQAEEGRLACPTESIGNDGVVRSQAIDSR